VNAKGLKGRNMLAHGVSRGLGASKKKPEVQDVIMKEHAFVSGMETNVPALLTITKFSRIINSLPQNHAIVKKDLFEFLSRPYSKKVAIILAPVPLSVLVEF
jgi:hypothetical protein